jgi:DNA-binding response OmpR family regulator
MARIALIDADRNCRTVCAAVLTHFGHEVRGFDRLADAAAQPAGLFDVFIVDPGWDYHGQDALIDALRRAIPAGAIIVLSGGVTTEREVRLRTGVRLLAKPFRIEALRAAIDEAVRPPRAAP